MRKLNLFILVVLLISGTTLQAQNREVRTVARFTEIAFAHAGKLYLTQGSPQRVELQGDPDVLKEIETEVNGDRLRIGREDKWLRWNSGNDKITVYITVPDIEAVRVSGSGNVIGQSKIRTDDLDLNVSGSGSLSLEVEARGDVEADVSGSDKIDLKGHFESIESDVSGSGQVLVNGTIEEDAEFQVSGSGKIEAKGSADLVKARISGSGKVLAEGLETKRCEVRISGSGDVEINVQQELDANISGSGSVSYRGNPKKVNSHSSGSGKVRKM